MPSITVGEDQSPSTRATPASPGEPATNHEARRRVDAGDLPSVSFAASGRSVSGAETPADPPTRGPEGHALVRVGPGNPGPMLLVGRTGLPGMNTFPIVGARIHPPLLRSDVLSRERLNSWLEQAVSGRLALIVAEAGFGKTTLLADWASRTRRLTAWYRLEPDDRDWLTFARHLVASGRELDPQFASETYGLLMDLGPGGPTREAILASLVTEIAAFGAAHSPGLTLIFDDYHAVDGSDEVVPTVRALLDLTGPQFSIVIATRSTPKLPLSRLRARGAISRLTGDALCFETSEADRLFRDAYRLPLERDVVEDLVERTDGWVALLSLVRANLEEQGRPNPRALVSHLDAGAGDLYDYLAEEVLAGLPPPLQDFLDRVSIFPWVDVALVALVDDRSAGSISRSIAEVERLGLLTRPDPGSPHRFHPLVRGFLLSRLRSTIGPGAVLDLHQRIATTLETSDWQTAAWHYREAGNDNAAARVLDASVDHIFASGQFERARPFLDGTAGPPDRPAALLLRSRVELGRGNLAKALDLAHRAVETSEGAPLHGMALLNLASVLGIGGIPESAYQTVEQALVTNLTPTQLDLAQAMIALWDAEHEGNLDEIADGLRELAVRQDKAGHHRYAGVTRVNLAGILLWLGEPSDAVATAARAELDLGEPETTEYVSAVAARATGIAQIGRLDEATDLLRMATEMGSPLHRDEAAIELAKILVHFGSIEAAEAAFEHVEPLLGSLAFKGVSVLVGGHLAIRRGDLAKAHRMAEELRIEPVRDAAGQMRGQLLRARAETLRGSPDAEATIAELARIASRQHSSPGARCADLLGAIARKGSVGAEVVQLMPQECFVLSMVAEELSRNLHRLTDDAFSTIMREAAGRPDRWSSALRQCIEFDGPASNLAATILASIGTRDDAAFLRSTAAARKSLRPTAQAISRRLAVHVYLWDLGRVELQIDGVTIGRRLRRKVLGLLCFLVSRPGSAASRDEAIDALWPELGVDTAANSLHQTIYFMRRIFEPDYREGMSAGYIGFEGDVLSVNDALIECASRDAWNLVGEVRRGDAEALDRLVELYTAKYALDFAYEEWASAYRDNLHAAVLDVSERGIATALSSGDAERAIHLAHRVLAFDPSADAVELLLVRAYKVASRHAAAAEQYAHYATVLRDQLGIEPPPIEAV